MKILKQTCVDGEIRVLETHIFKIETDSEVSISLKVMVEDDIINIILPNKASDWNKWHRLRQQTRTQIRNIISKALGKTL